MLASYTFNFNEFYFSGSDVLQNIRKLNPFENYPLYDRYTVMALFSRDDIFTNFTKKVAFRENIIVNSCASVALLHLKQSAS